MAQHVGVDRSTVTKWAKGVSPPTAPYWPLIEDYFSWRTGRIAEEAGEAPPPVEIEITGDDYNAAIRYLEGSEITEGEVERALEVLNRSTDLGLRLVAMEVADLRQKVGMLFQLISAPEDSDVVATLGRLARHPGGVEDVAMAADTEGELTDEARRAAAAAAKNSKPGRPRPRSQP